jgi:hypothetical protein
MRDSSRRQADGRKDRPCTPLLLPGPRCGVHQRTDSGPLEARPPAHSLHVRSGQVVAIPGTGGRLRRNAQANPILLPKAGDRLAPGRGLLFFCQSGRIEAACAPVGRSRRILQRPAVRRQQSGVPAVRAPAPAPHEQGNGSADFLSSLWRVSSQQRWHSLRLRLLPDNQARGSRRFMKLRGRCR